MSHSLENDSHGQATASCVANLIHAFTNGLDIFKRLRDRRRKRKHHKHVKDQPDPASIAELQLSNSLRRGTTDIQSQYENHYCKAGPKFAKGLVGIIATFLNHDPKSHLNLDYKSLTNLSDASRADAIDSLNHLYQRLSQSQLHVYRIGACAQCGSMKHQHCPGPVVRNPSPKGKGSSVKKKQSSLKSRSTTHTIARVQIKSSPNASTQLAVVRPRTSRKGSSSSSSSSSTKSQSTVPSSPYASPLESPLPEYTQLDPFPVQKSPATKAKGPAGRRRAGSMDGPRPTTWPHTRPDNTISLPPPPPKIPSPRKVSPIVREKQQLLSPGPHPTASPIVREKQQLPSPGPHPTSRRLDKPTPSTYTFASDSTKLGEIPQRNWSTPWNYEEADRLNAEALVSKPVAPSVESKQKGKKGIFKFLRRGTGESS